MTTSDHLRRLQTWLGMWADGSAHASDVAFALQAALAQTGDAALYRNAPAEVQAELLEGLRRLRETGACEVVVAHSTLERDLAPEARLAIAALVRAGILGPESAEIAPRRSLFTGLEHARGGERLAQLVGGDPALVSARLVALGLQPVGPFESPQAAMLSIQVERHARVDKGGGFFEREPLLSCVARFALHRPGPFHFAPVFRLDHLVSFDIQPVPRKRGPHVELSLGFGSFAGSVSCEEVALHGLDMLSVEPPA